MAIPNEHAESPIFPAFARLLEEERVAIRNLDGSRLDGIASEKVALMNQLAAMPQRERAAHARQLRALVRDLRNNGILLVHARGILRDVLRIKGAQLAEPTFARPGMGMGMAAVAPLRSRLSVRG